MTAEPVRVLSLGAGVQSSALYRMSVEGIIAFDLAIFADTRDEPAAVYENLWALARLPGPPIIVGSRGSLAEHCIDASAQKTYARNPPLFVPTPHREQSMLRRKCTEDFKIGVIRQTLRKWLGVGPRGKPPKVRMYLGITTDEAHRQKTSRVQWIEHVYPLIKAGMSRSDCHAWFFGRGLPSPPKSACWHCPYRSDADWRRLRATAPGDFARAVRFDKAIRGGFKGMDRAEAFVHRSLVPLDDVEFSDSQIDLFGDECAGFCGV